MAEKGDIKHYGRRKCMRLNKEEEEEDRLSSLPDSILIHILSFLPIDAAAATSVLFRHWRHLWTGVTSFHFDSHSFTAGIVNILQKLTSSKLHVFHLDLLLSNLCTPNVAESCFHHICSRNVEQIIISAALPQYDILHVPACVFATQSLVILDLDGSLQFDLPDNSVAQIPNLKKLRLRGLLIVPPWLGTLIRSCTLLEDLDLMLNLFHVPHNADSDLHIFAHKLKSLCIYMHSPKCTKIFIDASNLTNLKIHDRTSWYYFVQNPARLVEASIDMRTYSRYEEDMDWMAVEEDYLHQMSKFIAGVSSVCKLDLHLFSKINLDTYFDTFRGDLPIFSNLVSLYISLYDIGLIGWKVLLLSLQCFPNLNHLDVDFGGDSPLEDMIWMTPDSIPDCLVISKLKTIHLIGLYGIDGELELLAYILSNAIVLEKIEVNVRFISNESRESRLWNACNFCRSLFRLPRGSTTCEIVLTDGHIRASSNAFENGPFS